MNILRKRFPAILVGCMLFCGPGLSWGADWEVYYEDGMEMRYYDKSSVKRVQKGVLRVAIKTTLLGAEEGKVVQLEMDCGAHKYRILSPDADAVIAELPPHAGLEEGSPWVWFSINSEMMAMYQNICEG